MRYFSSIVFLYMITWNIESYMQARGWTNASQLAEHTKLSKPAAYRVLESKPLKRIDIATLEELARVFRCSPWDLLTYRPK